MTPDELQQRLMSIGLEVDRAAALLVSPIPANLDRCSQLLESASIELANLRSRMTSSDAYAGALAEAQRLQRGVHRATALLERAAQFHQDWSRIQGAMCAGYQADGRVAPVVRQTRLSVEG